MKNNFQIVLLEDNLSDAELIKIQLMKLDIEFELIVIDTIEELHAAFTDTYPDLVISDYNLPGMTGSEVLGFVHEKHPKLPFILVSGYLDAQKAVEIMVAGAADYVLKDNLSRLRPAVKRELLNYEEYKKQQKLLEASYDMAKIGHWELDLISNVFFWSPQVKRLYEVPEDYKPDLEAAISFYKDDESRKIITELVQDAIERGTHYEIELPIETARGNTKWVRTVGDGELNGNRVLRLYGTTQDITDRKRVELDLQKKEREVRSITDNISGLFQRYKLKANGTDEYEFVSKGVEDLHELPANEVRSNPEIIWQQVLDEDKQGLKASIRESAEDLSEWNHKWRIRTPSGKTKWIHGRGFPIRQDDGSTVWDSIKLDITRQERAIIEREELYGLLEDSINEVYVFDQESLKFLYVNKRVVDNTLYLADKLYSMTPLDLNLDHDLNQFRELLSKLNNDTKQLYFEARHKRADGTFYPVEVYLTRDIYKGEKVYVANILDVTEKQQANKRLRMLLETAPIPIFIESKDGLIIDLWNKAAEDVLGFTKEEVLNKRLPHVNKQQLDDYYRLINKIKSGNKIKGAEITRTKKDGTEFSARINASPLFDEANEIDSILVTLEDITEEKRLEKKLLDQVEFASSIIDSLPGLFYMMDADLNFVRFNENVYDLFNINKDQLGKLKPLSLFANKEREKIERTIQGVKDTGYAETETVMIVDGQSHYFYLNGRLIEFEEEQYILGCGIDITERVTTQKDNEVLLKEVHHRVKNNLAIISGLLLLEIESSDNEELELPLRRSVNRIQSIAKVHELLYNSNQFSSINLDIYLNKIAGTVKNTMGTDQDIDITIEVDDIEVNINTGIPLGMLFNELITNSLKYAFGNDKGKIQILLKKENELFKASYSDNGKGIEGSFDLNDTKTLGMKIVHTLLTQLNADFELNTSGQFQLEFSFKEKETGSHGYI